MRRSYLLFAGLLLVCIAFLSLGLVQEGAGKTITVDDDGGADYEKIQWAIENATEGDTIQVAEGTYYENVLVNKTLTLVGAGPEKTTIDASGDGDVVSITVDWCNVSGFKMTGSGNWDVAGLKIESHHNQIDNINSSDNDVRGIHLVLANHNSLTNISCYSNNEHGLYSHWSHHNTFTNVICVGNDNGAYFTGSDYNDLTNFQCTDNVDGLHLKSTDDNNLTQIECSSNDNGIYLDHSRGNSFSHIVCDSNSLNGMEFQDSDGNELLFGNFTSNTQNGIWIYHSEDIFISNVTSNSNDNGIGFEASNGTIQFSSDLRSLR